MIQKTETLYYAELGTNHGNQGVVEIRTTKDGFIVAKIFSPKHGLTHAWYKQELQDLFELLKVVNNAEQQILEKSEKGAGASADAESGGMDSGPDGGK